VNAGDTRHGHDGPPNGGLPPGCGGDWSPCDPVPGSPLAITSMCMSPSVQNKWVHNYTIAISAVLNSTLYSDTLTVRFVYYDDGTPLARRSVTPCVHEARDGAPCLRTAPAGPVVLSQLLTLFVYAPTGDGMIYAVVEQRNASDASGRQIACSYVEFDVYNR
jgi:hypothetical protein